MITTAYVLLVLSSLALLLAANYFYCSTSKKKKTIKSLSQFRELAQLATYEEARPRLFLSSPRPRHLVLLFHGFSASPHSFATLMDHLEQAGLSYYAPLFTGFGLNDLHLLKQVKAADWLRDAMQAYDLVQSLADQISLVGHSNGGTLATFVAQHRPVKHLILSGPNLFVGPGERKYKKMLQHPLLAAFLSLLMPMVTKPQRKGRGNKVDLEDQQAAAKVFHYPHLPIGAVKALWDVQDQVDIAKARAETLTIVYGRHDASVDLESLFQLLQRQKIKFTAKAYGRSAHNLLEDYDRHQAAADICRLLLK